MKLSTIDSRKRASFCALLLIPLVAVATPPLAANWIVDRSQSKLAFSGLQTGTPFEGKFTRFDTSIAFDPTHLNTSHIDVTVETGSASTGNPQRDNVVPGKDWLDADEFPHAKFHSRSIRKVGADSYEAIGTLTIRGITRPITVPLSFEISGDTAHLKGHVQLVRTAFGVGQCSWASPQWVALEVGVDFDMIAKQDAEGSPN